MERLYKILNSDGSPCHGGTGLWSLPHDGRPGEWMPRIEKLIPCESGYHLCREQHLLDWLGPVIYIAEGRRAFLEEEDKVVFQEARLLSRMEGWTEKSARLFACDCAERVLHFFESISPPPSRPWQAIETARRYAMGEASEMESAAAREAARVVTWLTVRATGEEKEEQRKLLMARLGEGEKWIN